ncbi:MAG: UpxY family transcription antiterminator [Bacteroidota bacterium]
MNEKKQWYAVYTRPRWEKKIANQLRQNKIEAYCPLNKTWKKWADRKKLVYEPLFTSYVFVYVSESEKIAVKRINSKINFVYWIGKPAVIREEEIEAIKDLLSQFNNVKLEKADVNIHDKIKITNGALIFREGNVIEVQSKSVRVFLPSLGYHLIAEVDKSDIEVIDVVNKFNSTHMLQFR